NHSDTIDKPRAEIKIKVGDLEELIAALDKRFGFYDEMSVLLEDRKNTISSSKSANPKNIPTDSSRKTNSNPTTPLSRPPDTKTPNNDSPKKEEIPLLWRQYLAEAACSRTLKRLFGLADIPRPKNLREELFTVNKIIIYQQKLDRISLDGLDKQINGLQNKYRDLP